MNRSFRLFIIIVAAALTTLAARAQNGEWLNYTFTGNVTSLADAGGHLWVGTTNGLVRLTKATGERVVYTKANSDMVDNRINDVAIDSSGRIWAAIGTLSNTSVPTAFAVFDGTSWQSYGVTYSAATSVAAGPDGTMWCSTTSLGRIYRLNGGEKVSVFPTANYTQNQAGNLTVDSRGRLWATFGWNAGLGLLSDTGWRMISPREFGFDQGRFASIAADADGAVLVGMPQGLVRYNGMTATQILPSTSGPTDHNVLAVYRDSRKRIWVLTPSELAVLDGDAWTVHRRTDIRLGNRLTALIVDDDGVAWLGSENGLARFDGVATTFHETTVTGLPENGVRDIVFDSEGIAWIGTRGGVARFDGAGWTTFTTGNSGLAGNNVRGIAIAPDGSMWFATENGVSAYDGTTWRSFTPNNSPLPQGACESIAFDREGNCWVGIGGIDAAGRGIGRYDGTMWTIFTSTNSALPNDGASAIMADDDGNVWVAMGGAGIAKYDGVTWTPFLQDGVGNPIRLPTSLALDRTGRLIIGTYYTGAFAFDRVSRWERFDSSPSGLGGTDVSAVEVDRHGGLWFGFSGIMAGDRGARRLDGTSWTSYDRNNSDMPEGNIYTVALDSSDGVWFGSREGIGVLRNGVVSSVDLPSFSDGAVSDAMLAVIPNPAQDRTTITYTVAGGADGHVRLALVDVAGRTVRTFVDERQESGVHRVNVETAGLAPGWYGVYLRCGGMSVVEPMVVVDR